MMTIQTPQGKTVDCDRSCFDFLFENTAAKDDDIAYVYYSVPYTYGKLRALIAEAARALLALRLRRGDRVLLSLITTPESTALFYACTRLGISPVLADVRFSVAELEELIENTAPRAVFLSDWQAGFIKKLRASFPDLPFIDVSPVAGMPKPVRFFRGVSNAFTSNHYRTGAGKMHWDGFFTGRQSVPAALPPDGGDGNTPVLFATSGTTGKRKYVVLTCAKLNLASFQHTCYRSNYDEVGTLLSIMPIFTCYGFVTSVHLPLLLGKKCFVCPIYAAKKVPGLIVRLKPNAFIGTPGHFEAMLSAKELKNADLSFLKTLIAGGEKISAKTQDRFTAFLRAHHSDAKLLQGYGMTEVASAVTMQVTDDYVPGSAGKPYDTVQIKVVEPGTVRPLPQGEQGEVCLHTPCQTDGYYRNDEGTAELIHRHDDGLLWVHTGDIGYLDDRQNLFIEGRIKRMLVTKSGTKVFLQLPEDTVKKLPEIAECGVVALPNGDSELNFRLIFFVIPKKKSIADSEIRSLVRSHCREELPMYLRPDAVIVRDSLPRTGSGKLDYTALQEIAKEEADGVRNVMHAKVR